MITGISIHGVFLGPFGPSFFFFQSDDRSSWKRPFRPFPSGHFTSCHLILKQQVVKQSYKDTKSRTEKSIRTVARKSHYISLNKVKPNGAAQFKS